MSIVKPLTAGIAGTWKEGYIDAGYDCMKNSLETISRQMAAKHITDFQQTHFNQPQRGTVVTPTKLGSWNQSAILQNTFVQTASQQPNLVVETSPGPVVDMSLTGGTSQNNRSFGAPTLEFREVLELMSSLCPAREKDEPVQPVQRR